MSIKKLEGKSMMLHTYMYVYTARKEASQYHSTVNGGQLVNIHDRVLAAVGCSSSRNICRDESFVLADVFFC